MGIVLTILRKYLLILFIFVIICFFYICNGRGQSTTEVKTPDLIDVKHDFTNQVNRFESQKEITNKNVQDGIRNLGELENSIHLSVISDEDFRDIYKRWKSVKNQIDLLDEEYLDLKIDAENLFDFMKVRVNYIREIKTKDDLNIAIRQAESEYTIVLVSAEDAIFDLKNLHDDALDIINALELAVTLGQIAEVNTGLRNIESKVSNIMADLNVIVKESRTLFQTKLKGVDAPPKPI